MLNEILWELGLTRDETTFFRLVSIYRTLNWGGKPQAVFIAKTKKSWNEVNHLQETAKLVFHLVDSMIHRHVLEVEIAKTDAALAQSLSDIIMEYLNSFER